MVLFKKRQVQVIHRRDDFFKNFFSIVIGPSKVSLFKTIYHKVFIRYQKFFNRAEFDIFGLHFPIFAALKINTGRNSTNATVYEEIQEHIKEDSAQ